MPYITPSDRIDLVMLERSPEIPGELNFLITHSIVNYIEENGLSYQTINDVVGALEGAKMEFYRRVAVPYEDKKIEENGDVY